MSGFAAIDEAFRFVEQHPTILEMLCNGQVNVETQELGTKAAIEVPHEALSEA